MPQEVRRFGLTGPTIWLDPAHNAYRTDVADIALAGKVIASHYAQPVLRVCTSRVHLRSERLGGGDVIGELDRGDQFALLDCVRGQAWGYALSDHRVGFVDEKAFG